MERGDKLFLKLILEYKDNFWPRVLIDIKYFEDLARKDRDVFSAVVQTAVERDPINGRQPDHLWRSKRNKLKRLTIELTVKVIIEELLAATDFDTLHSVVERVGLPLDGIGPLTVYDTAYRLGNYRRLQPELIYLHAGTAEGAKNLGGFIGKTLDPRLLRPVISDNLTPAQIEDWLCINKDRF
jgi:hypothetical protein